MRLLALPFLICCQLLFSQAVTNPANPTSNPNQIAVTNSYLYLNKMHYAGTWSAVVIYNSQDLVFSGGVPYIGIQLSNLNNTPASSPLWWTPVPAGVASAGGTNGQVQYNSSGAISGFTLGGDCTVVTSTGVITCTKTNGVVFPTFPAGAIVGTTDTQALTNKTLDGISPAIMGFLSTISSDIQTQVTGKQATLGFTAENAANKDAVSGYAGLTAGSLLKTAEFPAFTGDCTTSAGGVVVACTKTGGVAFAAVATSGSATDLGAGTLPAGREPAHTGDVTNTAGSLALTVGTVGGATAAAVALASTAVPVVARISLTAQAAAITTTTAFTAGGAGTFRLCISIWLTTNGTGGNIGMFGVANAGLGASGAQQIPVSNASAVTNGNGGGCIVMHVAAASTLQYLTTFNAVTGSPVYSLDLTVEQLK